MTVYGNALNGLKQPLTYFTSPPSIIQGRNPGILVTAASKFTSPKSKGRILFAFSTFGLIRTFLINCNSNIVPLALIESVECCHC